MPSKPKTKTAPLDIAELLRDEETITAFLTDAIADNDPAYLLHAQAIAARARNMNARATAAVSSTGRLSSDLHR